MVRICRYMLFPHHVNAVPLKQVLSWKTYPEKNLFKILIFCFFVPNVITGGEGEMKELLLTLRLDFCYSEPAVISGIQTVGGIVSEYCDNTTKTMHPVQLVQEQLSVYFKYVWDGSFKHILLELLPTVLDLLISPSRKSQRRFVPFQ